VATSEATASQAKALGIPLVSLNEIPELDLTVDGADEVDPELRLIKGGGGALLREKIVASASKRMAVIADSTKLVPRLGAFPLPIEVVPFGLAATRRHIERAFAELGLAGPIRLRGGSSPFVTDGGHSILDCSLGVIAQSRGITEVPQTPRTDRQQGYPDIPARPRRERTVFDRIVNRERAVEMLLAIHKIAHERKGVPESELNLDLFATQGRRGRQNRDLVKRQFELLCAFKKRGSRQ